MSALDPYVDPDELFIDRHVGLEWADDVHAYRCTRCQKVLVQHYIANCEHKFCGNCKRVVDDGSQRWRCPNCREFIKNIDGQSAQFKDKVMGLRVHCLNRNYGCQHICPFKDIKEHLAGCEHTKERALPVLYHKGPTVEMLDRMFSAQLLNLRNEMNRKFGELEKRDWELSVQADEVRRVMLRMERRQKEGEERVVNLNKRVDKVEADLKEEIYDLQRQPMRGNLEGVSLAAEENKSRIVKLETKSEAYFEMLEVNNRKNNEQMHQLKNQVENELKVVEIQTLSKIKKFEQTMNEMKLEQQKKCKDEVSEVIKTIKKEREKREEVTLNVNKNTSQLATLNLKVESLGKDLQTQWSELNQSIETMGLSLNEVEWAGEKKWVENNKKWAEVDARIDRVFSALQKVSHSVISDKIPSLKKKMDETEESIKRKVYHSIVKPELQHLRRVSEYYKEKPDFTWIVSDVNHFTNGNSNTGSARKLLSDTFRLKEYPFTAGMKMTLYDDDHNKIWFSLSFNDKTKTPIDIKPLPNIFLTVKDQKNKTERKNIIKLSYRYNSLKEKFQYNNFFLVGFVKKSILQSAPYKVENNVQLDIHVEPPEVARMVYSHDGTLTWAIDDYRKKKQMEADGLIESYLSPYFYTSPNGYRMQLKIRLNGYGDYEHKGLSLRVVFLSGLYDAALDTKFSYKNTVTIFHPHQPDRNISKSEASDYERWNRHSFDIGKHAEIEDFLYNDTLFYKVAIEINKSPTK